MGHDEPEEMEERQMFLSEGFCGLVLSRCGEAHHIRLAEARAGGIRGIRGSRRGEPGVEISGRAFLTAKWVRASAHPSQSNH